MKKITQKRTVALLLVVIMLTMLTACGGGKSAIIGRWVGEGADITFYDDGTFSANMNPKSGTYSVSSDQLKLTGNGDTMVVEYKISGNKLTMTFEGQSFTLDKKS